MSNYPRWEATTTRVSDLLDVTYESLAEDLRKLHEHGMKLHNEAMEYAQCWPNGYEGFGASFYETYGPNIAEMFRKELVRDPKFGRALVMAEYE